MILHDFVLYGVRFILVLVFASVYLLSVFVPLAVFNIFLHSLIYSNEHHTLLIIQKTK